MTYSTFELRSAIHLLRQRMGRSATANHIYRVNSLWMERYFSDARQPKWLAEIETFAATIRNNGEQAIYLDICGNAVANRNLFGHTYQVSMAHGEWLSPSEHVTFYRRDIFDRHALQDCIEALHARGVSLLLTTFRPIVGLSIYTPLKADGAAYKDVVHQRLFNQLEQVVANTRIGGYIYLERPFQMDESIGDFFKRVKPNQMTGHRTMLTWARRLRCSVRMCHGSFGQKWLLRKDYKQLGPIP